MVQNIKISKRYALYYMFIVGVNSGHFNDAIIKL